MQEYRASKQCLNEVHDMEEDWAADSTRPHTMFMDLEESKLNFAHYIAFMAMPTDPEHVPSSYSGSKNCSNVCLFWKDCIGTEC